MEPNAVFPLTIPFTSQVIVAPARPQKEAAKLCVCPRASVTVAGEIEFALAHTMVIVALADLEASATLVAVTVRVGAAGGTDGAV